MRVADLNIDVGELPDEPAGLVALAGRVNVACGGHAGDAGTMRAACARAKASGARVGAHPSYVDRPGFGRVPQEVPPDRLRAQVAAQCASLRALATSVGVRVEHVKPHGALYHCAAAHPAIAAAVIDGAVDALGAIAVIGPPTGALAEAAARRGLPYLREGFADRGLRADGSLVPRGEPGALIHDPAVAAAQALRLAAEGFDTLCVHGDAPGAEAVATAVRDALAGRGAPRGVAGSARASPEVVPLGAEALRVALPGDVDRSAAAAALAAVPGVREVWLAETHAAVRFEAPPDPAQLAAAARARGEGSAPRELRVRVAYDGPDLERVAAWAGLDAAEVAARHARVYTVRYIGFLPGFAYLGEVDPAIAAPRLDAPRSRVPPGTVGVAGARTGVYPCASPGGWNLIGRAVDFVAFDARRGATLRPGDRVRFEAV